MKTQMTITVDADIKRKFQIIAKKMGTNVSSLTNMYFTQVVNTGRVELYWDDNFGKELYNEYINSTDASKAEETIIVLDNNMNKKSFTSKINDTLWT